MTGRLRNQACHCGSGKKFKRCCGNEAMLIERERAAWTAQQEINRSNSNSDDRANPISRPLGLSLIMAAALSADLGGRR